MKKIFILASSISALVLASSVFAEPVGLKVDVRCPLPNDQTSALANYGDFIAGHGFENVQGQGNVIYFKSKSVPENAPTDLRDYRNGDVRYNSTNGEVTCRYVGGGPEFSVVYAMTNGKGGFVSEQSQSTLSIVLPVALAK